MSLLRVGNQASRRVAEKIGMTLTEEIERRGAGYWLFSIASPSADAPSP